MKQEKFFMNGVVLFVFLSSCSFAQVYVDITGTGFSPSNLTVDQGTTVTWVNADGNIYGQTSHSVTSDLFSSNDLGYGDSLSYTFNVPGTFAYRSGSDDSVTGTVNVLPVTSSTETTLAMPETIPSLISYGPAAGSAMEPMTYTVIIKDAAFNPGVLSIPVGSTVEWVNNDGNAWSNTQYHIESDDGSFSSGLLGIGGMYSYVFNNPGVYSYSDRDNSLVSGVIMVYSGPVITTITTTTMAMQPVATTMLPSVQTVIITDDGFNPANIQIPLGTTVTWVNNGANSHRVVTSGDLHVGSESQEPQIDLTHEMEFASKVLGTGDVYGHTFVAAGTYYYYDDYNPSMKGTITVG